MAGRLIIVGDSFCVLAGSQDPFLNWCQQTAKTLKRELLLCAGMGISQDWQWDQLIKLLPDITPDDKLLVVMTHLERKWYREDKPGYTHVHVANLPDEIGYETAEAVRQYVTHLQRPSLDLQHMAHRLGWLSAQAVRLKLEYVWVLQAFGPMWYVPQIASNWPDIYKILYLNDLPRLLVSEQNLYDDVQEREMIAGEDTNSVFKGVDARYNHMCRDNHTVLSQCVVQAITESLPISLTHQQWLTKRLHKNIWEQDKAFCNTQFDPIAITRRNDILKKHGDVARKAWKHSWFKSGQ